MILPRSSRPQGVYCSECRKRKPFYGSKRDGLRQICAVCFHKSELKKAKAREKDFRNAS